MISGVKNGLIIQKENRLKNYQISGEAERADIKTWMASPYKLAEVFKMMTIVQYRCF